MRYLFYNDYGDADDLVATAPPDVECVPFGIEPIAEEHRYNKLRQLDNKISISALPSLIYHRLPYKRLRDGEMVNVPADWVEIRVYDMPKPWNWAAIDLAIEQGSDSLKIENGPPK